MSPLNQCRLVGVFITLWGLAGTMVVPFVMCLLPPWASVVFVAVWCSVIVWANIRYRKVYYRIPQEIRDRLEAPR